MLDEGQERSTSLNIFPIWSIYLIKWWIELDYILKNLVCRIHTKSCLFCYIPLYINAHWQLQCCNSGSGTTLKWLRNPQLFDVHFIRNFLQYNWIKCHVCIVTVIIYISIKFNRWFVIIVEMYILSIYDGFILIYIFLVFLRGAPGAGSRWTSGGRAPSALLRRLLQRHHGSGLS